MFHLPFYLTFNPLLLKAVVFLIGRMVGFKVQIAGAGKRHETCHRILQISPKCVFSIANSKQIASSKLAWLHVHAFISSCGFFVFPSFVLSAVFIGVVLKGKTASVLLVHAFYLFIFLLVHLFGSTVGSDDTPGLEGCFTMQSVHWNKPSCYPHLSLLLLLWFGWLRPIQCY